MIAARFAFLVSLTLLPTLATAADGDWHDDAPGKTHRIDITALPKPYATHSAFNQSRIAARPENAVPLAPPGFAVSLFAKDLEGPRLIRTAPNGDIFVVESKGDRIHVFRTDAAGKIVADGVFAGGLNRPFGLSFYPPGPDPKFMYVGNTDGIVRFPYKSGDLKAGGPPEVLVHDLWSSGGHWTRDVVFSPDGKKMFVSVGSGSNVAEGLPDRSAKFIADFEAHHGRGAAWDREENRADVLAFDPDGQNLEPWATGIRNCVSIAVRPGDGSLWCATNERDGLGDDLPPDYVAEVKEGAFFGWPWFYTGSNEDPRHPAARGDLYHHVNVPDFPIQPHSAPLQAAFYDGAMFPEFRGSAFVALHGSWTRAARTGYKYVRLLFKDGKPTGEYEDFLTGFVVDDASVWGRPVGVGFDRAGAILVTEDGNNTMWRVTKR